jgi:hypothetical protein
VKDEPPIWRETLSWERKSVSYYIGIINWGFSKKMGSLSPQKDKLPSDQENRKIYETRHFWGGKASVILCIGIINLTFRKK